ncbi:sigma-70 family RNA polymerase sigma factor [Antrihabitans cavernicola]|uniref:Sigma-70 family RNA polymerase sigma factor n=1 Tax=Antrihabitans cavernicola TaxID=2495913 RepID=A0A5A7S517_9NOCA|nr:sigma-70 family RNA polymerase sigma factor [Spelaeibacter cavernicola]
MYSEHVTPIWRYVRARLPSDADAEDVTSEVFAQAVRSWDGFDAGRGSVGGWLVGISRHVLADWWRRRGREVPSEDVRAEQADPDQDPESWALRLDGADDLRRHLGMLSVREREAVALRFGTELSSEQIGAAMGISPTAARMLVYRAVAKLREVMPRES